MKEIKEKLKSFAIICLWGFGAIGGVCFALYGDSVPCAIACALNAALAFPSVKNAYNKMME